jgi:hypothetical protein
LEEQVANMVGRWNYWLALVLVVQWEVVCLLLQAILLAVNPQEVFPVFQVVMDLLEAG